MSKIELMFYLNDEKRFPKAYERYLPDALLPKISTRSCRKIENNLDSLDTKLPKLTSSESYEAI